MHLLIFLAVGLFAGWLAGQIWKGRGFGFVGNLLVGVGGSFLGKFLFNLAGFHIRSTIAEIIAAVMGALILLWIVKKIRA
jgi:uncharacterized membrane protein YeaQ/YmgE (transglycosylase-associated protein family)